MTSAEPAPPPDWALITGSGTGARFGDDLVLLTLVEVADILRMTPRSFSQMLHQGRFPVRPVPGGRRKLWRLSDLKKHLTPKEA